MQCQVCNSKEASVHVKQIVNGAVTELHACMQCAQKQGIDVNGSTGIGNMLFGPSELADAPAAAQPDTSCPECHMRASDLRRTHRLGCPGCYTAFGEELAPMLRGMHRGRAHVGKVPAGERDVVELRALEEQLASAVDEQRFEDAASLRDRIQSLRKA